MTSRASGEFEVKVVPQQHDDKIGDPVIGRLALDKQFRGDLAGTSKGQMLATRSEVQGSAAYVAMERVEATLAGRTGSFVLHHVGTMQGGAMTLTIRVAPDSGTAELLGITGTMQIEIEAGKHSYIFDYELPSH